MPNDLVNDVLSKTPGYEAEVFDRYFKRLLGFAESRLPKRLGTRVDSEDIVQSVFRSFFRRNKAGEFSFTESLDLWRLLVAIAYRKVLKSVEHHARQRRDFKRDAPISEGYDVSDLQPTPDQVNLVLDEFDWLLSQVPESNRPVVEMRLEGYSIDEVADKLEISQRTVKRVMHRVRAIMLKRLQAE